MEVLKLKKVFFIFVCSCLFIYFFTFYCFVFVFQFNKNNAAPSCLAARLFLLYSYSLTDIQSRSVLQPEEFVNQSLNTMILSRQRASVFGRRILLVAVLACSCLWQSNAYRVGDSVPMTFQTPTENLDAMRNQRPVFGMSSSSATFEIGDVKRFSLVFEDGIRPLLWIETSTSGGNRRLETVTVTFVYSKSGEGTIEHMSSETNYTLGNTQGQSFKVEYEWIEEAPVDLMLGSGVMFLSTCIASLVFLGQACGVKQIKTNANNMDQHAQAQQYGAYGENQKNY